MQKFNIEEVNLMCMYDTHERAALIAVLKETLVQMHDTEMLRLTHAVIKKLSTMSDQKYNELSIMFVPAYENV